MIDINKFHGQGDIREWLNAPFSIAEKVVATNGHVMAILGAQNSAEYKEFAGPEGARKYIIDLIKKIKSIDTWQTVNKGQISPLEKETCNVCQGSGKAIKTECGECEGEGEVDVSNGYSTYYGLQCASCNGDGFSVNPKTDETCTDCDGSGKSFKPFASIEVLGINVQCKYMALIIDEPDLQLAACPEQNLLMFRAGLHAHGAIMALREL